MKPIDLVVGTVGIIVGLGLGEILKRTESNPKLPRFLRWITIDKVVHFLMVVLALSTMLTVYTSADCQAKFNERTAKREQYLNKHQDDVNEAAIKALDGILANPDRSHVEEWRTSLVELQAEREKLPPEAEIRC